MGKTKCAEEMITITKDGVYKISSGVIQECKKGDTVIVDMYVVRAEDDAPNGDSAVPDGELKVEAREVYDE